MDRRIAGTKANVWAAATLLAVTCQACGAEPGAEGPMTAPDTRDDVGTTTEPLAAIADGIWIPPVGQLVTTIYYCFETVPANIDVWEAWFGGSAVNSILLNTWRLAANVDFVDEGPCASAAHASTAVRIKIQNVTQSIFGRSIAGVANGMSLKLDTADVAAHCPGIDYVTCVQHQAVHEFGHALGFTHDSIRGDYNGVCPNGNRAVAANGPPPDELITAYDPGSIEETSYCRVVNTNVSLSATDIAGARAVYGSGDNFCNAPRACVWAGYDVQSAIRFQNGRYLQPRQDGGVQTQTFVGTWERVRIKKVSGSSGSDIQYGDVIAIQDRWGLYMSARDNNDVTKQTFIGPWEKWVVESPNTSFFSGKVLKNGPVRFRSQQWNKYLYVNGATDVAIKTGATNAELRIHGPFMEQ